MIHWKLKASKSAKCRGRQTCSVTSCSSASNDILTVPFQLNFSPLAAVGKTGVMGWKLQGSRFWLNIRKNLTARAVKEWSRLPWERFSCPLLDKCSHRLVWAICQNAWGTTLHCRSCTELQGVLEDHLRALFQLRKCMIRYGCIKD